MNKIEYLYKCKHEIILVFQKQSLNLNVYLSIICLYKVLIS